MSKTGFEALVEAQPIFGVEGMRDLLNVLHAEGRVHPNDSPEDLMAQVVGAGLESRGFFKDSHTGQWSRPSLRAGASRVRKEVFDSVLRGNDTCISIVRDTGRTKATVLRNLRFLMESGDVAKIGEHNETRYRAVSNG